MSKTEFKPDDFSFELTTQAERYQGNQRKVAYQANKRLAEIKESWKAEMLKDAVVVYCVGNDDQSQWTKWTNGEDTHKALLINIEPIVKECVKHEAPKKSTWYEIGDVTKCVHCGVELVAEWKEK